MISSRRKCLGVAMLAMCSIPASGAFAATEELPPAKVVPTAPPTENPSKKKPKAKRLPGPKILSVDGPAHITVREAGKTVKLRLAGIDSPRAAEGTTAAECGAAEATAALRVYVKRAAKKQLSINYLPSGNSKPVRGADGRVLAAVDYRSRKTSGSLGDDLVLGGWARLGVPQTATDPEKVMADTISDLSNDDAEFGVALRRRGVWAKCGGFMHLPAGQPAPAYNPAIWSIDANGITRSLGGVPLSPVMTPEETLTFERAAEQFGPLDVTIVDDGCTALSPTRHLLFYAFVGENEAPADCGKLPVFMIASMGPETVATDSGVKTGMRMDDVRPLMPILTKERVSDADGPVSLAPDGFYPWAWTSGIQVDREQVYGFVTYSVSLLALF